MMVVSHTNNLLKAQKQRKNMVVKIDMTYLSCASWYRFKAKSSITEQAFPATVIIITISSALLTRRFFAAFRVFIETQ
jgi:hypothetical protein